MKSEWRAKLLGDVITLKRGYDLPGKNRVPGEIPIFSSSGISGTNDKAMCSPPGVITGRYGTIGQVFYSDGPYWPLNTTLYVEDFKGNVPRFVYYYLKTVPWGQFSGKSAVPGVNRNDVHRLEVEWPPIQEQEIIASVLASIDKKIELNQKINDNLQQQAFTLFDSFYNRADDKVGFTEIIQILGGGTPKTGESSYWDGDIPFFTPKDVGSPYVLKTEKTITKEGLAHCNSRFYSINTVFVTARGTVGKVSMSGVPMAMNQSCYALVGKNIHQLLVYFYVLKTVDRLKHKASGAVFDAITTRDFESESIFRLSDMDAESFLSVAEPIYQAILNNAIENQRLSVLRDTLLPKLMSGEMDVSNV